MLGTRDELKKLMKKKFMAAGMHDDHADDMAEVLAWSSERGLHSHGEVRVEYYTEHISKGGMTVDPKVAWTQTGPRSGILDADNGCGYPFAIEGMQKVIDMAKEHGIGFVGVANVSHTGAIGYYTEMAAKQGMIGLSCTQSDPMVIPYGGAEPFYGTNPIAIAAPTADGRIVSFDMATTVQAWGKILDAKSAGRSIPEGWAVDEDGRPVTDPHKVNALVAIAGPKGYGLMMMVDILSGVLLGVPAGKHVSSLYHDLSEGRRLGHLNVAINPEFFCGDQNFREHMSEVLDELNATKPGVGFDKVYWPGERAQKRIQATKDVGGIEMWTTSTTTSSPTTCTATAGTTRTASRSRGAARGGLAGATCRRPSYRLAILHKRIRGTLEYAWRSPGAAPWRAPCHFTALTCDSRNIHSASRWAAIIDRSAGSQ